MRFIADLHIHSRFSRATSKALDPENLHLWAQKKGVTVLGTGDFTHPQWLLELQQKLEEDEEGLYRLKTELRKPMDGLLPASCLALPRFLLTGEISCIYKKKGRTRKVHHLVLMPDFESVRRLNERLSRIGNLSSDGRPILGLDSKDLLGIVLESSDRAFLIPAHVWTPWFSLFGSNSGFDAIEECFEDLTPHVRALETGLSSDPAMNRLLSGLDPYLLVSNSDAHSPSKVGREANLFDTALDYPHMIQAMTTGEGFVGTIEFFPEEGKYHLDGHRKCKIRIDPLQASRPMDTCPVCHRPLTVGVLHRVQELSDRTRPNLSKDFFSLVPLSEILSEIMDCGPTSKAVEALYEDLLKRLGPELPILMDLPLARIEEAAGPLLREAIDRMRRNLVVREGGYDGEYGTIRLFRNSEKKALLGQMALFRSESPRHRRPTVTAFPYQRVRESVQESFLMAPPSSASDPILDPLNPEQRAAVLSRDCFLLVVAGPGTGKTLTLTHRIAHLIRSGLADPQETLALTFTRKAAREMEDRILMLLKAEHKGPVAVSTFHSFCLQILRNETDLTGLPKDFILCPEGDAQHLMQEVAARMGLTQKRGLGRLLKDLLRVRWAPLLGHTPSNPEARVLLDAYQERMRGLQMIDLEDLEVETLRFLRKNPLVARAYGERYPWIFVDEYQDTNPIQVLLLKALVFAGATRLFAIGDPDQAIYGFRGSEMANFNRFVEDFPGAGVIRLARNYRSTESILRASAHLLGKPTPLQGQLGQGDPLVLVPCRTEFEEAEVIVEEIERFLGGTTHFSLDSGRVASHEAESSLSFGDLGVLYRLNAQGDALEQALDRAGIPVIRSGEAPLVTRFPVNVIYRFLQVLQSPDNTYYSKRYQDILDTFSLQRPQPGDALSRAKPLVELIEDAMTLHGLKPAADESEEALGQLRALAERCGQALGDLLDRLSLERGMDHATLMGDRVALMSMHAAKGLEWPVVFITGCEDGLIPCSLFGNRNEEEERRLFYVAMTRARKRLLLLYSRRRQLKGRVLRFPPSPFLDAIPKDLCTTLERGPGRAKAHTQLRLF